MCRIHTNLKLVDCYCDSKKNLIFYYSTIYPEAKEITFINTEEFSPREITIKESKKPLTIITDNMKRIPKFLYQLREIDIVET